MTKQVLKKLKSIEEIEMFEFYLCLWWLFTACYRKFQIYAKPCCFHRLQPRSADQVLDDLFSSCFTPLYRPPKKEEKEKITVEQITTNHILSFINISVGSSKKIKTQKTEPQRPTDALETNT